MKRYYQYQPVVIENFEATKWRHPVHKHNHYELVYIRRGKGVHVINGVSHPYKKQQVFLLGPEDDHYFDIHELTSFTYLKFTDLYFYKDPIVTSQGLQKLEYIIKSRKTHFSGFSLVAEDQKSIDRVFDVLVSLKNSSMYNEELIWYQLLSIATILQRNMPELNPALTGARNKDIAAIFCYLHKHIYTPERLRAPIIAKQFNISADYIGPYFKRNTGLTLRNYIRDYRKGLINQRLASGRYNLKDIAAEFGLTDESHVSKIIRE